MKWDKNYLITIVRYLPAYISSMVFRLQRQLVFELDITSPLVKVKPLIELSYRMANSDDIASMDEKKTNFIPERKRFFIDRLQQGDQCLLAFHKETLAGYLWLMKGAMELSRSVHLSLPDHRAYVYNGYVINEYRGKRVINALRSQWIDMLRAEGKTRLVATVYHDNASSIQTIIRSGYEKIGTIWQTRVMLLNFPFLPRKERRYLQSEADNR